MRGKVVFSGPGQTALGELEGRRFEHEHCIVAAPFQPAA
jgi:hypothetical protein